MGVHTDQCKRTGVFWLGFSAAVLQGVNPETQSKCGGCVAHDSLMHGWCGSLLSGNDHVWIQLSSGAEHTREMGTGLEKSHAQEGTRKTSPRTPQTGCLVLVPLATATKPSSRTGNGIVKSAQTVTVRNSSQT